MIRLSPVVIDVKLAPAGTALTPHKHYPCLNTTPPAPVWTGTQRAGELSGAASWAVKKLGADTLDFKACIHNLDDGQRTDIEAPLNIKSFTLWKVRHANADEVEGQNESRFMLEETTTVAANPALVMIAKTKLKLEHENCHMVILEKLRVMEEARQNSTRAGAEALPGTVVVV